MSQFAAERGATEKQQQQQQEYPSKTYSKAIFTLYLKVILMQAGTGQTKSFARVGEREGQRERERDREMYSNGYPSEHSHSFILRQPLGQNITNFLACAE